MITFVFKAIIRDNVTFSLPRSFKRHRQTIRKA